MVRALAALAATAAVLMVVLGGSDDGAEAQLCLGLEAFDFDTYEAYDNAGLYLAAIELAAAGEAVTVTTTPSGLPLGLEYPGLLTGSQDDRLSLAPDPTLRIPPTLLKSIVWVESEFAMADGNVPWGGTGQISRSFDCGFGLGQITTGMENRTGNPSVKQALVGTHFLFNVAEAARMLAEKWNSEFLPIAGGGDPAVLEDWYYAVWAYNGLFFTNHPQYSTTYQDSWLNWLGSTTHPFRDPLRGDVWHCNDPGAPTWISYDGITPVYGYGDYTYPERVYGCMRHPPEYPARLYNDPEYAPQPWAQPTPTTAEESSDEGTADGETTDDDTTEEEASATPSEQVEPAETSPTSTWPEPGADGLPRLWPPVKVNMPDPTIPSVAAALSPEIYAPCADSFWYDGCPAMHFPTSFPNLGVTGNHDPTPAVDPSLRERLVGAPHMEITGPREVAIAMDENGVPGSAEVLVQNRGTWIAPFRILTSDPWIHVRRGDHPNGPLHGGVAMGTETTIVICRVPYCEVDVTKRGHIAVLEITVNPALLPEGEDVQGTVQIEPLLGEGDPHVVVVHAGSGVEVTEESDIVHEEEEEDDKPLEYRIVVPGLAKDE